MKKRSLSDWAAIAEIAGTAAVIVSLVFVIVSIRQNTEELRLQNENFLYELQDDAQSQFVSNPWLVDISVKLDNGEELTASEERRYFAYVVRATNLWEMIFFWHRNGHIEAESWREWDHFYSYAVTGLLTHEQWTHLRATYSREFVEHVDPVFEQVAD